MNAFDEQGGAFERVLVAIAVPPPTSVALSQLPADIPQARWHTPDQFHLTLRLVGEVDSQLKAAIAGVLGTIVVEPFILPVERIGLFPLKGQPQVVYIGVDTGHPRLFQLQRKVEEALSSLGLPLELRAYNPHITLARVSRCSSAAVADYVKRHRDTIAPGFRVESFGLYTSQLTHYGTQYNLQASYPLKPARAKAG